MLDVDLVVEQLLAAVAGAGELGEAFHRFEAGCALGLIQRGEALIIRNLAYDLLDRDRDVEDDGSAQARTW